MLIGIIDGMGGGIGSQVITCLRKTFSDKLEIVALGINPLATGGMMKNGANQGASGENAIVFSAGRMDVIIAPLTVVIPNSMLGEVSLAIAEAVYLSKAKKYLIPILPNDVELIGIESKPLLLFIREIAEKLEKDLELGQYRKVKLKSY